MILAVVVAFFMGTADFDYAAVPAADTAECVAKATAIINARIEQNKGEERKLSGFRVRCDAMDAPTRDEKPAHIPVAGEMCWRSRVN